MTETGAGSTARPSDPGVPQPRAEFVAQAPVVTPDAAPVPRWRRLVFGLPGAATAVLLVGVIAGLIWTFATPLTEYTVTPEGTATTTEWGLSQSAAPVVWFSILALILGVVAGMVLWLPGRRLRWAVIPVTLAVAFVAEMALWAVGELFGPGPLHPRIIASAPGTVLPQQLTLDTWVPLLMAPLGAAVVQAGLACFGPDPDPPRESEVDERWAAPVSRGEFS